MMLSATQVVVVLCVINTINFIYCVIIPSAPVQFQSFVQDALGVSANRTNAYMGLVESTNFTTYAVSLIVFGFLSKKQRPFHLITCGVVLWSIAAFLCGFSYYASSFAMVFVGRGLSGIAEASYSALSPPFIEKHAPETSRNFWTGAYYGCMSLGTGIGYIYGSRVAASLGWNWSFLIAGIAMAPLLCVTLFAIPDQFNRPFHENSTATAPSDKIASDATDSFVWMDLVSILKSPMFITSTLGLAAHTFFLEGLSVFGPAILIGRQVFPTAWVAPLFGAAVVVGGILGGAIGGYAMDAACAGRENDRPLRLRTACRQRFAFILASMPLGIGAVFAIHNQSIFLPLFVLTVICLYATLGTTTTTILLSVPESRHGLATGLSTALTQVLGSVPAPLAIGVVKDWLSPGCGGSLDSSVVSEECASARNQEGLQWTLLLLVLWLSWALLLWSISLWIAERTTRTEASPRQEKVVETKSSAIQGQDSAQVL
ncbi:unnamed protein product [Aphanomyces euteiches]